MPPPSTTAPAQPEPELTLRAILVGLALGSLLAISNLYLGLKAGWAVGVSMPAIVLAAGLGGLLRRLGARGAGLGMLEANAMASVASALAFSSAAPLFAAIPALWMLGERPPMLELMGWLLGLSLLGIALAWPLRERIARSATLRFPSGVATAELLHSLGEHAGRVSAQARALVVAALSSGLWSLWTQAPGLGGLWRPGSSLSFPGSWAGRPLADYGLGYSLSGLPLAVGAILGPSICAWMLAGSGIAFLGLAPILHAQGLIEDIGFRSIMSGYALWFGAALMLSGSLTELAFDGRIFARALRRSDERGLVRARERVLVWLFLLALGVATLGHFAFGVALWQAIVGVTLAALFVPVAVRAMGETDITPVGDFSKMTQLIFGGVARGSLPTNVAMASLVAGTSATAADLAERQRCTQRIGGNVARQSIAYAIGGAGGALLLVPVFYLLVPNVSLLGSEVFPAPAAQSLRAVAQMFGGGGMAELPALGRSAFLLGCMLGIAFAIARRFADARWWLPSVMGLGMGFVLDLQSTFSFFVGAMLAWTLRRRFTQWADVQMLPIAAGLVVGESLAGVCLALWASFAA